MKTKFIGCYAEPTLHEAIRRAAFRERCSMGELMRRALLAYLAAKGRGR